MKAAFPRGARAFRSERWLVKLATTIPRSRGSPLHLAPRVWGRRAGCAVSWSSGFPRARDETSPRRRSERSGTPREMYFSRFFSAGFASSPFVLAIFPRYLTLGDEVSSCYNGRRGFDDGSMGSMGVRAGRAMTAAGRWQVTLTVTNRVRSLKNTPEIDLGAVTNLE